MSTSFKGIPNRHLDNTHGNPMEVEGHEALVDLVVQVLDPQYQVTDPPEKDPMANESDPNEVPDNLCDEREDMTLEQYQNGVKLEAMARREQLSVASSSKKGRKSLTTT